MEHGGLPLSKSFGYNADTLLSLTYAMEDGDDDTKESLRAGMCPESDSNNGSHDSNDENTYWEESVENKNYGDYTDKGRYGNIKGYGYATDRCLCYTDGSGCDCDDQDEDLAVRNLATYGTFLRRSFSPPFQLNDSIVCQSKVFLSFSSFFKELSD